MSETPSRQTLIGRWLRVEQTADGVVYKRAEQAQRTRPRHTLEFRSDGSYSELRFGPSDRSVNSTGTWELDGHTLRLRDQDGERTIRIQALTAHEMIVA